MEKEQDLINYIEFYSDLTLQDLKTLSIDIAQEIKTRERVHNKVCVICRKDFQFSGKNVLRSCCSKPCATKAFQTYCDLITKADIERREYISKIISVSSVYSKSVWRNPDAVATADLIVYGASYA